MDELHPHARCIVAKERRQPINDRNTQRRSEEPDLQDSGKAVSPCGRCRKLKDKKWPARERHNERHNSPVRDQRVDADGLRFDHRAANEHRQPEDHCDHEHASVAGSP